MCTKRLATVKNQAKKSEEKRNEKRYVVRILFDTQTNVSPLEHAFESSYETIDIYVNNNEVRMANVM